MSQEVRAPVVAVAQRIAPEARLLLTTSIFPVLGIDTDQETIERIAAECPNIAYEEDVQFELC